MLLNFLDIVTVDEEAFIFNASIEDQVEEIPQTPVAVQFNFSDITIQDQGNSSQETANSVTPDWSNWTPQAVKQPKNPALVASTSSTPGSKLKRRTMAKCRLEAESFEKLADTKSQYLKAQADNSEKEAIAKVELITKQILELEEAIFLKAEARKIQKEKFDLEKTAHQERMEYEKKKLDMEKEKHSKEMEEKTLQLTWQEEAHKLKMKIMEVELKIKLKELE